MDDRGSTPSEETGAVAAPVEGAEPLAFGAFSLHVPARRLERDGVRVPLGDKAFEILRVLVARAGEVVSKAELLRHANLAKEDSLRFHIVAIRKALGEGRFIANIAGQGYSFVATVSRPPVASAPDMRPISARPLPGRPRRLIGRDEALRSLREQLLAHRFVTVVGPGGVGKTSVALTLAHDLASGFGGDICFFDVGNVSNPDLLAGSLASALGIPAQPGGAAPGIVTFLQRRRMLLVLDGCEPGVDAAALIAEQIFRATPEVHLLATSREALRADGEYVHRLFPLEAPAPGEGQTPDDALRFGAVQLFVERTASSLRGYALTGEDAPLVSEICRKLDGLALALELAAGRVSAYGIGEVARQLENQFALLWPGRRTAVARHQTLSATLEWSHRLLTPAEQTVFRRLSVFAGAFTLGMATAVVADEMTTPATATELIGSLVAKSLVQFQADGARSAYRLLDITRSYAADRLADAAEARRIAERHARVICGLLTGSAAGPPPDSGRRPGDLLEDVGAALAWSLSADGDLEIAAALAVASGPAWLQSGLLVECRFWMTRVLEAVDAARLDPHRRLSIQATLASADTFTEGFTEESFNSWRSALAIAASVEDIAQQLTCLVVLWAHRIRSPDYPDARRLSEQAAVLAAATKDRGTLALADWMVGVTRHHLGDLTAARVHLERSLANDTLAARQVMMMQFGYDRRIPSMGLLSTLHWLVGRPDTARRLGASAVTEARNSPYPVPLCEALTWQALILHLRGDAPLAVERLVDETIAHARQHFIESYVGLGLALKGLNAASLSGTVDAVLVSQGLELLSASHYEVFHPLFLTELARLRAEAGEVLGDEEVDALLRLDERHGEHWGSAEIRRNLSEVLRRRGEWGRAAAFLASALACAERQGAVGWGLRAAHSAVASATDPTSRQSARTRLALLLEGLAEGAGARDIRAARRLLATEPASAGEGQAARRAVAGAPRAKALE